jgi:hypothetical protein
MNGKNFRVKRKKSKERSLRSSVVYVYAEQHRYCIVDVAMQHNVCHFSFSTKCKFASVCHVAKHESYIRIILTIFVNKIM